MMGYATSDRRPLSSTSWAANPSVSRLFDHPASHPHTATVQGVGVVGMVVVTFMNRDCQTFYLIQDINAP